MEHELINLHFEGMWKQSNKQIWLCLLLEATSGFNITTVACPIILIIMPLIVNLLPFAQGDDWMSFPT
jgi:hypothetical protein